MASPLARFSDRSDKPANRPLQALELQLGETAHARRLGFRLRRRPEGIELSGTCLPAPDGIEVAICAGAERACVAVAPDGSFRILGLPDCANANVFVRGGGLPALAFFKLAVE